MCEKKRAKNNMLQDSCVLENLPCFYRNFCGNGQLLLMVRLDSCVDDKRCFAFPVLVANGFVKAVNVLCGVGTRERKPQEIAENVVCGIASCVVDGTFYESFA